MDSPAPAQPVRPVRSFVRRNGRRTPAQTRALQTLTERYGLAFQATTLDLDAAFARRAPRVLEIGFGDGEVLMTLAGRNPDVDFVGIEVHEPGVGHLLLGIEKLSLTNVRVLCMDAAEALPNLLPAGGFQIVNVFFPDPWPKKRHHKRRLIQPQWIDAIARIQPPDGLLHLATDWAPYAEHMTAVLADSRIYAAADKNWLGQQPLAWRPDTKFERRGLRKGHEIADLYYRRT